MRQRFDALLFCAYLPALPRPMCGVRFGGPMSGGRESKRGTWSSPVCRQAGGAPARSFRLSVGEERFPGLGCFSSATQQDPREAPLSISSSGRRTSHREAAESDVGRPVPRRSRTPEPGGHGPRRPRRALGDALAALPEDHREVDLAGRGSVGLPHRVIARDHGFASEGRRAPAASERALVGGFTRELAAPRGRPGTGRWWRDEISGAARRSRLRMLPPHDPSHELRHPRNPRTTCPNELMDLLGDRPARCPRPTRPRAAARTALCREHPRHAASLRRKTRPRSVPAGPRAASGRPCTKGDPLAIGGYRVRGNAWARGAFRRGLRL